MTRVKNNKSVSRNAFKINISSLNISGFFTFSKWPQSFYFFEQCVHGANVLYGLGGLESI